MYVEILGKAEQCQSSKSLGQSPIELLWDELDNKARIEHPQNAQQLWDHLQEAWQQIDPKYYNQPPADITPNTKINNYFSC